MSFSYEVKKELCRIKRISGEAKRAELYGMLLFGKSFNENSILLQTENGEVAKLFISLLAELHRIVPATKEILSANKKTVVYKVHVVSPADRKKLLEEYRQTDKLGLRIHPEMLTDDSTISSFFRGAYLSCGTVTDPGKSYHLEFSVPYLMLSEALLTALNEVGFPFKSTARKDSYVVYIKESENIEDLLTYMGAQKASLEMMNVKIYKDLRNKANRVTNCETANIEKTVNAAWMQIEEIEYIKNTRGIGYLPDELKELALLRIENPELSLRELGAALSSPLSRSGVNHRLKRISEIAEKLREPNQKG